LDQCDENGIVVGEEVTAWGNSVADFSNPHFMAAEMITLHRMVDHSVNHPCVVIFAFFNEGQSHNLGSCCPERQIDKTHPDAKLQAPCFGALTAAKQLVP
jgi:beta-galactosidase/beta-glucuronidase